MGRRGGLLPPELSLLRQKALLPPQGCERAGNGGEGLIETKAVRYVRPSARCHPAGRRADRGAVVGRPPGTLARLPGQGRTGHAGAVRLPEGAMNSISLAVEKISRALRTRPDYDLRCDDCGAPHILDTSIPSAIWNKVASDVSCLCTLCIDDRVAAAGLSCRAEFYFVGRAVRSRLYDDSFGDVAEANRA